MRRIGSSIVGMCLQHTKCDDEFNRLELISPITNEENEYLNKHLGEGEQPPIRVYDTAGIPAAKIDLFIADAYGTVNIMYDDASQSIKMRGDVETLAKLIEEATRPPHEYSSVLFSEFQEGWEEK